MKVIDMRFNNTMIQELIGKQFNKFCHDPFEFTNSVTQIVGLYIGDEIYSLTNKQEVVDYFGNTDDIAVLKLCKSENSEIKSALKDVNMISTPVNETIVSVKIVNENQKVSIKNRETYDIWLTRAIIISTGEREISFEKDTVPFSEEIIIQRGYNLVDKCSDKNGFLEGWDEDYIPECIRDVIEIK